MATAKQIAWRKKFVKLYGGKKKKSSRKKSMRTGDLSEDRFVKRLKETLGKKSLVFRTGINASEGIPDIMAFSRGKLSFYEIKPGGRYNIYDNTDQFLRKNQEKWIQKNCFENKIKVYIVFYIQEGRKSTKFTYYQKRLTKQNLKKYSQSSPKSNRKATLDKMYDDTYSGKIRFT